jgi:hypothetical protein
MRSGARGLPEVLCHVNAEFPVRAWSLTEEPDALWVDPMVDRGAELIVIETGIDRIRDGRTTWVLHHPWVDEVWCPELEAEFYAIGRHANAEAKRAAVFRFLKHERARESAILLRHLAHTEGSDA